MYNIKPNKSQVLCEAVDYSWRIKLKSGLTPPFLCVCYITEPVRSPLSWRMIGTTGTNVLVLLSAQTRSHQTTWSHITCHGLRWNDGDTPTSLVWGMRLIWFISSDDVKRKVLKDTFHPHPAVSHHLPSYAIMQTPLESLFQQQTSDFHVRTSVRFCDT